METPTRALAECRIDVGCKRGSFIGWCREEYPGRRDSGDLGERLERRGQQLLGNDGVEVGIAIQGTHVRENQQAGSGSRSVDERSNERMMLIGRPRPGNLDTCQELIILRETIEGVCTRGIAGVHPENLPPRTSLLGENQSVRSCRSFSIDEKSNTRIERGLVRVLIGHESVHTVVTDSPPLNQDPMAQIGSKEQSIFATISFVCFGDPSQSDRGDALPVGRDGSGGPSGVPVLPADRQPEICVSIRLVCQCSRCSSPYSTRQGHLMIVKIIYRFGKNCFDKCNISTWVR